MPGNFEVDADFYEGIDIDQVTEDALDAVAVDVQRNWQENMDRAGYRNTGETINSITIDKPEEFVRLIGSDRIAALIGEVGRAPGAGHPPPDELGDWVAEQAGLPKRGGTVKWEFDGKRRDVSFDQVVYLIGRAINENGLPAHRFGERAARDAPDLDQEIGRRLENAVDKQAID